MFMKVVSHKHSYAFVSKFTHQNDDRNFVFINSTNFYNRWIEMKIILSPVNVTLSNFVTKMIFRIFESFPRLLTFQDRRDVF